ncbi:FAD/NAD(P)-binding domain-containing protein [Periconia macrospinosa]|uniref:FAD/NAD(P)-binding domain-containing protein n=1 Tax=Periconia macrospinosa TaxID=97972 RepID=A0A2V1D3V7_9PLEO|nr:FAD/NAD(P)-binding domain-containing protein [Periconia macrospinosa]
MLQGLRQQCLLVTHAWVSQLAEGVLRPDSSICVPLDGIELAKWDTGEVTTRTAANPVGKQNAVHHGDMQLALLDRAKERSNIEIRLGAAVIDVDVEKNAVLLSEGQRIDGFDLIIGADGVKSTIKAKVCDSEAAQAKPTGEAAYRFTLDRRALESDEELLALVQRPWAVRWDGPSRHVVAYPVRNHERLNVVLIHPDSGKERDDEGDDENDDAAESWTSMASKHDVVADYQGWNATLLKLIVLAPADVPNFRMFAHLPSPAWFKGSTILLGDACHAMLPYLGQGIAQAVDDTAAIVAVLSLIQRREQLPLALQAYETSRKGRVEQIQAATLQAREHLHLKDAEAQAARDLKRKKAVEAGENSDVVKMQQSYWEWNAAEVARCTLVELMENAARDR